MLSRVVLVADAFDAITNHRSYQPALSVEFAIQEITTNSGTQFDPGRGRSLPDLADSGRPATLGRSPSATRGRSRLLAKAGEPGTFLSPSSRTLDG